MNYELSVLFPYVSQIFSIKAILVNIGKGLEWKITFHLLSLLRS